MIDRNLTKKFLIKARKLTTKWSLAISILFVFIFFLLNWWHHGDLSNAKDTLFDHAWIEIASGVLIYLLLELKFKEYGDVPIEDGERDYSYILDGISKSKKTVKIFDNDFASFFEDKKQRSSNYLKERLREAFHKCIINLDKNQRIQILLLHPNTPAAQQRNEDLQFENFDLFIRMNEGLQFLQDFLEELSECVLQEVNMFSDKESLKLLIKNKDGNYKVPAASKVALLIKNSEYKDQEEKKLYNQDEIRKFIRKNIFEVKLFKTSYSMVFVSWDDYMNFSVLPPKGYSDKRTFRILKRTQLANYFNGNFKEIWEQEDKTVALEEYKKVIIKDDKGKIVGGNISWGNDSNDYNIPVFIYLLDKKGQNFIDNAANQNFQIIHDNEMRWAKISKIKTAENNSNGENENSKANFKPLTFYEFAKKQIKTKSDFEVPKDDIIYQIKYLNKVHKINLSDEDYVMRHLDLKGYCYTSYSKYQVQPGMHLMRSLVALYDFYIDGFDRFLLDKGLTVESYKRIVAFYLGHVKIDGTVNAENFEFDTNYNWPILTKSNLESNEHLNNFILKTIAADLSRIFGQKYKRKNGNDNFETNGVGDYYIRVVFIKARVTEKAPIPDWFIDGFDENKATYTVLHFVGKKNVLGGVPFIWINKTKAEREYNFHSPLDSIYFKSKHVSEGKEKIIEVDSSATQYFGFKEGEFGFRNLIAIEIFDSFEAFENQNSNSNQI